MLDRNNLAQLRWACRRGMLELDVLLGRFLERHYPSLSVNDQELFLRLLSCEDQDLFHWLIGNREPEDPTLINLVARIRQHG